MFLFFLEEKKNDAQGLNPRRGTRAWGLRVELARGAGV
jgi:hypothetical protein